MGGLDGAQVEFTLNVKYWLGLLPFARLKCKDSDDSIDIMIVQKVTCLFPRIDHDWLLYRTTCKRAATIFRVLTGGSVTYGVDAMRT